jgi:hypothetical protein
MEKLTITAKVCFLTIFSLSLFFTPTEAAFAGSPVTLTFDDLAAPTPPSPSASIPSGYGGLQWSNFLYANTLAIHIAPSGYSNGVVSAPNVAVNGFGQPASLSGGTFDLDSAYLTGAWDDGLQVEVQGFVGNTLTYDNTWTVNSTGPTLINFNYLGVTSVQFITSGGVPHGYGSSGEQFAMDNLTITFIPEPATLGLAGLSVGVLIIRRGCK